MGSGIELIRMTIYVFFPVALFYYFNRPEFYRKTVQEKKKILYPEGNHPPLSLEENNSLRLKLKQEKKNAAASELN